MYGARLRDRASGAEIGDGLSVRRGDFLKAASASLLYGAYPRMKATGMEDDTFATRLRGAGYSTGFFGKYNNDYDEERVPPGWDRWFAFREPLNRRDFYEFNSEGKLMRFDRATHNETDVIAERVAGFVRSRRGGGPWLVYVCPHDPHGPYFPADRHKDAFPSATWDPASEGEADLSDKPALVRKEPTYSQVEEAQNEQEYRGKLRELRAVDDLVKKILRALAETGQLANTYVLFFTDNGYLFGEHRLQKKNLPYDEACRVPFVARSRCGLGLREQRPRLPARRRAHHQRTRAGADHRVVSRLLPDALNRLRRRRNRARPRRLYAHGPGR